MKAFHAYPLTENAPNILYSEGKQSRSAHARRLSIPEKGRDIRTSVGVDCLFQNRVFGDSSVRID